MSDWENPEENLAYKPQSMPACDIYELKAEVERLKQSEMEGQEIIAELKNSIKLLSEKLVKVKPELLEWVEKFGGLEG